MTKYMMYVIRNEGWSWMLRRAGRYGMAAGPTPESVKEQAFDRLRGFAPCAFRVSGDIPEEWRLASDQGEWEQVEP